MNLAPVVGPLRKRIAALRQRARSLLLLHGSSRLALLAIGLLALQFVADYTLRLPLGARAFYLVILLGALALTALRRIVRPMLVSLDDISLARRIEEAHPEMADRLVSTLAFEKAAGDPENDESAELMQVVAEQTSGMSASLRFSEVAQSRIPVRWAGAALVLLAGALFAVAAHPTEAGIFLQRSVLLRDVDWPRRTTLEVVGQEPGQARRVTLGRETAIQIRARGSAPDRVTLTYWERNGSERSGRPESVDLTPSAEDGSLFLYSLQVQASYGFSVAGGDDDRALPYSIEAMRPPAVLGIEMDCAYPAYLGRANETLRGGDQRVPEGTAIHLRVRSNMPLERANLLLGSDSPQSMTEVEPALYAIDLVADRDLRYGVRLLGQNGEENDAGIDTYMLRVAKDRAPIVRILTPSARTERHPGGVVLVSFVARDDYAIAGAGLRYVVGNGKERTVPLGESGGDAIRLRRARMVENEKDSLLGLAVIDLAHLLDDEGKPIGKGAEIQYAIDAKDNAGQAQASRSFYRIECVTEEDLTHVIEARQQELRESVERARDHASATAFNGAAEARTDPAELRRWTGRAQATQARVIDDLDTLSRHVQNVLNLYVFNRLGDAASADQLLPYFESHLLEAGDGSGLSFRGSLYRGLWLAQQEKAIRAGLGYAKLVEMADLADRLAADAAPAVYRALGRAGARDLDPDAVTAALDDAERERRGVIAGLDRLARLMREWQNFEGAVRAFKALRDTQEGVIRDLEGLLNPGR